jgi:hypothetical protein
MKWRFFGTSHGKGKWKLNNSKFCVFLFELIFFILISFLAHFPLLIPHWKSCKRVGWGKSCLEKKIKMKKNSES